MNQGDNFQVPFLSALRKWKEEEEKWENEPRLYREKEYFIALFYKTGFYFSDRCFLPIISHCFGLLLLLFLFFLPHSSIFFKKLNFLYTGQGLHRWEMLWLLRNYLSSLWNFFNIERQFRAYQSLKSIKYYKVVLQIINFSRIIILRHNKSLPKKKKVNCLKNGFTYTLFCWLNISRINKQVKSNSLQSERPERKTKLI